MPARSQRHLFVTGTDTGVGKTRVAARLIESLRAVGARAVGYKPVLSGEDRGDALALWRASGGGGEETVPAIDEINPVWLRTPVAPLSARLAGETAAGEIDRCLLIDTFESLAARHDSVIVEGAGGWEVPLTESETFATLARTLALPVLVVAANRLGVLNHTLLTVGAVRRAGLGIAAVILNEIAPPDPDDVARATNLKALRRCLPDIIIEPVAWEESGPFPSATLARLGMDVSG